MTPDPARILLADHRGDGLAERLGFLADEGYELAVSRSLRETLRRLEEERPALLVLDSLTRQGAVELLALAEADAPGPRVPVLVVGAREDPAATVRIERALSRRAWDLLPREAGAREIEARVGRMLRQARLLAEMDELRHRASHDDRTDLLRPQTFERQLQEHFSAAQRHKFDLTLVLLDLDKFGQINKRHDHTVGDRLIEAVGRVIRSSLRTEDVAGRLGGDEFAVLLPYTGEKDARLVVERLRERIEALSGPFEGAEGEIPVSSSLGYETYDGADLAEVRTLRRHAERALRVSKRGGGNSAIYFRSLEEGGEAAE